MLRRMLICAGSLVLCAALAAMPAWSADSVQATRAAILMEIPRYLTINNRQPDKLCLSNVPLHVIEELQRHNHGKKMYKMIASATSVKDGTCDLLYVEGRRSAQQAIRQTMGQALVLISNYSEFIHEGGTIGLVESMGSVSMELNLSNAGIRHVVVRPDLIEVSKRVVQ